MGCRMICLDVDGTILNTRHQITKSTRRTIAEVLEKGTMVVLVSARMPQGMEPFRKELGLQNVLICYGGALIMENGLAVFNKTLPLAEAHQVVRTAFRLNVHVSLYRQDRWIVERTDDWSEQESAITGLKPEAQRISSVFRKWNDEETGPNKLLFMADSNRITELKNILEREPLNGMSFYRSKPTYLEVVPSSGSKRQAVSFLCARYGIPKDEVLAIGDSENDLDMIQYAGIGVAMGNASASVKNAADFVTRTNDEDGAAFAIHNFAL